MTPGQIRMLRRFVMGDTPRCSPRDYEAINAVIPGVFQRESRDGADLRGGYILCDLRSGDAATQAAQKWLTGLDEGSAVVPPKPFVEARVRKKLPSTRSPGDGPSGVGFALALAEMDKATTEIARWMSGTMAGGIKCIGPIPQPVLIERECRKLKAVKARHAAVIALATKTVHRR